MKKLNLIWIIGLFLMTLPLAYADNSLLNLNMCGGVVNSTAMVNLAGSACTATDNGGDDCFYTCTGGANQNQLQFDKWSNTSNSSWYMVVNMSWDSSGGLLGWWNNRTVVVGELSDIAVKAVASCNGGGTICVGASAGGVDEDIYLPATDTRFYLKNITWNGSVMVIYNIPYQSGQSYTINLTATGVVDHSAVNYFNSLVLGRPAGSPTFTFKFGGVGGKLVVMNVSEVTASDTTKPIGNTSFNISTLKINDVINFTSNITDETALLHANWTINFTSKLFFNYSFPASTTKAEVSNSTKITCGRGCVLNFTLDVTDTSGNFWQNSTIFTIADTRGTIQIGTNISTMRINDMINISGNITEPDGDIAYGWATFNRSGNPPYNLTFTLSGNNANFSTNFTINLSRGQVTNFTVYYNDTGGAVIQNSTLITVINTLPPSTSVVNVSDKNWNTNLTLNITPVADADSDSVNYIWYMDSKNPPTALVQNSTLTSFTTNWTNETIWYINVTTFDNLNTSISTSLNWNGTLDTSTPVWQETFVANGSFYRISTNITYNCTDTNLFEVNTTTYRNSASNSIFTSTNFTNLTPTRSSREINLSIDVSIGDTTINVTRWCGDTKNKKRPMTGWNAAKSADNRTLQFNNSGTGLQCNISYGSTNPAERKFLPLTANVSLKMSIEYKNDDFYKIDYEVVAPNTGFTSATKFICNQKIVQVFDNLAGHLLMGTGKEKLSYDAQDLIDSGFTVDTKLDEDDNQFMHVIKKSGIIEGAVVSYDPRADNLNIVENSAIVEIDTGVPQIFSANISLDGFKANNTYFNKNYFNLSVNASDKNNASILIYLNDVKNISGGYQSNITANLTLNLTDGNYTIKAEANDSAGNKFNFTLFYAIDATAPTFSHAYNRTIITNSTDITTATGVNLTIVSLGDIYLDSGNFSENCTSTSRNWINHSFASRGNNTYHNILRSTNFTVGQVCGWKFYAYDLAGNELDPIYTFKVNEVPPSGGSSGGGSSGGSITIPPQFTDNPQLAANPFGTDPVNSTCKSNEQIYDGKCYACDPEKGYLQFNPNDRSVQCILCNEGFYLDKSAKECKLLPPKAVKNELNEKIDSYAMKISKVFKTDNILVGYFVIISGVAMLLNYGIPYLKKK